MAQPRVLAIVLAGGEGKRLMPLTVDRAKPAVPFGGIYRLIDFSLSNMINSGFLKVVVLTQYKSHSLDRHISKTWRMSDIRHVLEMWRSSEWDLYWVRTTTLRKPELIMLDSEKSMSR